VLEGHRRFRITGPASLHAILSDRQLWSAAAFFGEPSSFPLESQLKLKGCQQRRESAGQI
jgi:hypothetical protein